MAGMSKRTKVLVYDGEGTEPESMSMLKSALIKHVDEDRHEVKTITPQDIIKRQWTKDCILIALSGGYDLGFINALGEEGTRLICDYVWNGGAYLGICAGGYFGCSAIEFDKGGSMEVVGDRDLKFYPGKCIGPAFAGFEYGTKRGAVAAHVQCNLPSLTDDTTTLSTTLRIHTDGGGYFLSDNTSVSSHEPEVFARFLEVPGEPAAVIKTSVGGLGGQAILSGVHFEFNPEMLDPTDSTHDKNALSALFEYDKDRNVLFSRLLQQLGIQTRPME